MDTESPVMMSGEEESQRSADGDRQVEKLKIRRSEVRKRISVTCNEMHKLLKRVGSRTSMDTLVQQVEALVLKSEKLTDQICAFRDKVDTAKEFQSQLDYQRLAQDAIEEVNHHQFELY